MFRPAQVFPLLLRAGSQPALASPERATLPGTPTIPSPKKSSDLKICASDGLNRIFPRRLDQGVRNRVQRIELTVVIEAELALVLAAVLG